MPATIRPMMIDDFDRIISLWEVTEHVGSNDTREGLARYLSRNPGMSFVAEDEGRIVGTVLGGHDGRRGFLWRMAVADSHRRQGLGRELEARAVAAIQADGIERLGIVVLGQNAGGLSFWQRLGWRPADVDLKLLWKRQDA